MKVYMLQDAVTGYFYGGVMHGTTKWFPQRSAKIWTVRREVTTIQDGLKPLYTTILREYTLKLCHTLKNS